MTELKPCPFCGEEPEIVSYISYHKTVYKVRCNNRDCPIIAATLDYISIEDAIEAWNRRADNG